MIYCTLQGGLANVMFQIAAISSLAKDHNTDVSFPNFSAQLDMINRDTHHNPKVNYAQDYAKIFKNLKINQVPAKGKMVHIPFRYDPLKFENELNYVGFFQCEKFFSHNRDFILNMFEPNDEINTHIVNRYGSMLEENTCAVHVRRGDYLKLSHVHSIQGMEYFNKAMEAVGEVDKYVVFSDDIEWCKSNFKGEKFIFIEGEKDYIDLFLMSMCKNQIISNSSFSWWAAWLNKNPNKKVVGPLRWFNEVNIDSKDILPESWIKIYV